jgi:hypothetical protein
MAYPHVTNKQRRTALALRTSRLSAKRLAQRIEAQLKQGKVTR